MIFFFRYFLDIFIYKKNDKNIVGLLKAGFLVIYNSHIKSAQILEYAKSLMFRELLFIK